LFIDHSLNSGIHARREWFISKRNSYQEGGGRPSVTNKTQQDRIALRVWATPGCEKATGIACSSLGI
jgi:hypothetical protein